MCVRVHSVAKRGMLGTASVQSVARTVCACDLCARCVLAVRAVAEHGLPYKSIRGDVHRRARNLHVRATCRQPCLKRAKTERHCGCGAALTRPVYPYSKRRRRRKGRGDGCTRGRGGKAGEEAPGAWRGINETREGAWRAASRHTRSTNLGCCSAGMSLWLVASLNSGPTCSTTGHVASAARQAVRRAGVRILAASSWTAGA